MVRNILYGLVILATVGGLASYALVRDRNGNDKLPALAMTIDKNAAYYAVIETDKGTMRFELNAKKAPRIVNQFVYLAQKGYYDGMPFRVASEFWAASGFSDDKPSDWQQDYEIYYAKRQSAGSHVAGTISMIGHQDVSDMALTEFFIMMQDYPTYDKVNSAFGKLVEGMEVLKALEPYDESKPDAPKSSIVRVTIEQLAPDAATPTPLPTITPRPATPTPVPTATAQASASATPGSGEQPAPSPTTPAAEAATGSPTP